MYIKCRCATNFCSRISHQKIMSGEWEYHMNIIHTVYPNGLHRLFYGWDIEKDEWMPVKHRVSSKAPTINKKNLWREIRCAYV